MNGFTVHRANIACYFGWQVRRSQARRRKWMVATWDDLDHCQTRLWLWSILSTSCWRACQVIFIAGDCACLLLVAVEPRLGYMHVLLTELLTAHLIIWQSCYQSCSNSVCLFVKETRQPGPSSVKWQWQTRTDTNSAILTSGQRVWPVGCWIGERLHFKLLFLLFVHVVIIAVDIWTVATLDVPSPSRPLATTRALQVVDFAPWVNHSFLGVRKADKRWLILLQRRKTHITVTNRGVGMTCPSLFPWCLKVKVNVVSFVKYI